MNLELAQNPNALCPPEIFSKLLVLPVSYYDFSNELQSGEIIVAKAVATDVVSFFDLARDLEFPIASVRPIHEAPFFWDDITSCRYNNSSGFNYRTIMGSDKLSHHSYGTAFDINPRQNIYVRFDRSGNETYRLPEDGIYNETTHGTLRRDHPLVTLMKKLGWTWGGDWTVESGRIDYQHFEKSLPDQS